MLSALSLTLTLEQQTLSPLYLSYFDAILKGFDFYALENSTICAQQILGSVNGTLFIQDQTLESLTNLTSTEVAGILEHCPATLIDIGYRTRYQWEQF